jgi:RNA polymerase sigma factor (sigma-70 family)
MVVGRAAIVCLIAGGQCTLTPQHAGFETMASETTQPSLLSRVRDPADDSAWREFDAKYRELILRYCRARGLQTSDAEDVRQIAMTNLARSLRSFEYKPARGRFRGYLGQVVRSAISRHFSRPDASTRALDTHVLVTVEADDAGQADDVWEREWVRHHYRLAMQTVRAVFDPKSVQIFDRLLAGDRVDRLAIDFQTTREAVHKVKQRIRDRLKDLITDQIRQEDDDGSVPLEP